MSDIEREDLVEVYANHVRLGVTAYDFSLIFGGAAAGPQPREHTVVRMSPQHAKSLLLLLQRFIAIYEREMGPVTLPTELEARLRGEADRGGDDVKGN